MHCSLNDCRKVSRYEVSRSFGHPHADTRERKAEEEPVHQAHDAIRDQDLLSRLHFSPPGALTLRSPIPVSPFHDTLRLVNTPLTGRRTYQLGKRALTAERTRRQILEAAWELICAAGFHPVSLDEVADRAGASRPTVYRHFGSKRGLFEAVMWDRLSRARLDRLDTARRLSDARDATREFIFENCRLFTEVGEALRRTMEVARSEPEIAHIVEIGYFGRRVDSLKHLAQRLEAEGCLEPGWTSRSVVDTLMILTSLEAFETLTQRRGRTTDRAARSLWEMAQVFLR